jgi:hypothetical protein
LLTGTSNQVISAGGHLLGGKIKSIIKRLGIYSNEPLLSNSNAMPKTKFPIHQRNARVSHRNQIESQKFNSIHIKTSNSAFYPTDSSASLLPPLYSGGTQRNYSSWELEFAVAGVQVQVLALNHHLPLGKSPPLTGAVLVVVEAA